MRTRAPFLASLALGLGLAILSLVVAGTGLAGPAAATAAMTGAPLAIAAVNPNEEEAPAVAYDTSRNRFLVVYENASGMNAICIDPTSGPVSSHVVPVSSGLVPDVVYNDDNDEYLIVWEEADEIWGARMSGTCYAGPGGMGTAFKISGDRTSPKEWNPAVAYNTHANHQEYLVVWEDGYVGLDWAIYARRVAGVSGGGDAGGETIGASFAITETTSAYNREPDIAYNLNMNEYLVVYTHDPSKSEPGGPNRDIYARRVKNAGGVGLLAEHAIDSSSSSQHSPAVAAYRLDYSTPYLVVFDDHWNDTAGDIRGYTVYTTGLPASLVNISTATGITESTPAIASSESLGGYTVVWSKVNGGDDDVYARRVSSSGAVGDVLWSSTLAGDDRKPAVAGGSPAALMVWQNDDAGNWDVYGVFLDYRVYLPLALRNYP